MLNIRTSTAETPNESFREAARQDGEDNMGWLRRTLPDGTGVHLLMVGGVDPLHFRLRVAQSHLRRDMTPSHWSHVALLGDISEDPGETPLYEISLDPERGFGFPAPANGVQEGRLADYRDGRRYPNVAVLSLPVDAQKVTEALVRFRSQRVVMDSPELIILWLAFAWGVGRAGNPLLEGNGVPSAAMVEVVMGASEYDLTPGLESRASCPEAIWQAARWWHRYYGARDRQPPSGVWTTEHYLVEEYD